MRLQPWTWPIDTRKACCSLIRLPREQSKEDTAIVSINATKRPSHWSKNCSESFIHLRESSVIFLDGFIQILVNGCEGRRGSDLLNCLPWIIIIHCQATSHRFLDEAKVHSLSRNIASACGPRLWRCQSLRLQLCLQLPWV